MAYRIGKHHDNHLVLATIQQVLTTGVKTAIFHSDQGNEFMADRCTHYLQTQAIHHQIHYHHRIHTALKMPPLAFAAQSFSTLVSRNWIFDKHNF